MVPANFRGVLNCAIFIPDTEEDEDVEQCDARLAASVVYHFLGTRSVGEFVLPRSEPYGGRVPAQLLVRTDMFGAMNEKATEVLRKAFHTGDYILGPAILLFGAARW